MLNIPNALTLLRILLVPIILIQLLSGHYVSAFWIFLVAGVTDALDGLLARILKQKTAIGAFLDPLADKVLMVSGFLAVGHQGALPLWLVVLAISRDAIIGLGILTLRLFNVRFEFRPTWISKVNTFLQILTLSLAVFGLAYGDGAPWARGRVLGAVVWLTGFFTVGSGLQYVFLGTRLLSESSTEKAP